MVSVSIYIVTPWSFEIERFIQATFPRLLLQILPPLFLSILVLVSNSSKRWILVVPSIFLIVYAGPLLHHEVKMIEDISRSYKQNGLGTDRYLGNEIWVEALELDKKLPLRSSGVILDRREYFSINYVLYPRYLYCHDPGTIAGTSVPWPFWKKVDEIDLKRYDFDFVIDGSQVVLRK